MDLRQLKPIGGSYEPLSDEDINRIENLMGLPLPEDYKNFLARFGRCGFAGEASVVVHTERLPVFTFYGAGKSAGSLLQQIDLHPDLQEMGALPIANDIFNNLYVLEINKGRVSRLDFSGGRATAQAVARCFREFLDRIEVRPHEDGSGERQP